MLFTEVIHDKESSRHCQRVQIASGSTAQQHRVPKSTLLTISRWMGEGWGDKSSWELPACNIFVALLINPIFTLNFSTLASLLTHFAFAEHHRRVLCCQNLLLFYLRIKFLDYEGSRRNEIKDIFDAVWRSSFLCKFTYHQSWWRVSRVGGWRWKFWELLPR